MTKVAVILESDGHGVKDSVHAALTLAAAFGSVIALTRLPPKRFSMHAHATVPPGSSPSPARGICPSGPICAPPRSRNASRPKTVRM